MTYTNPGIIDFKETRERPITATELKAHQEIVEPILAERFNLKMRELHDDMLWKLYKRVEAIIEREKKNEKI
jgi:hypothetical protein